MSEFQEVVKDGAKNVGKRIKQLLRILLGIGLLTLVGYFAVCNYTYSKGTRSGILVKISKKGVAFKTYEGTLNLGGFSGEGGDGSMGNMWNFSVWKTSIYQDLDAQQGNHVKLYYREKVKAMPWQGDTEYFVYKVEKLND